MAAELCARPDCGRIIRARGLCVTHYNHEHQPDRHRKVTVPCGWCARPCEKEPGRERRYTNQFCSLACRDGWRSANKRPPAPKPPKLRTDMRSPLRRALEDGDGPGVIVAVKDCTTPSGDCWEWTRQFHHRTGYPTVNVGTRTLQVHRVALEARWGRPLGAQAAHHTCANRKCVNPEHLQPVTQADNMAEMLARTYMVQRIRVLEAALRSVHPSHPALAEISVDHTV